MTFRLPFQISRVGALCRPTNPDGLVSKLVARKGNLKNLILYQIKQLRSANLLQECKHKTTYVPTRYSTTKTDCEYLTKPNSPQNSVQKAKAKAVAKECGGNDYYKKLEESNIGPYLTRGPNQAKSKKTFSTRCNKQVHTALPKYDYYGMESYYSKIKDIDDKMSTTTTTTTIKSQTSPPEIDIKNILPDTELKIQNDIWKQSGSAIINNLNSKNSIWRFIYGKRQTLKHNLWKDLFTSKMLNKFIQTSQATKIEATDSTVKLGTKQYPHIYLSTKRKVDEKLNLDNNTNKIPSTTSKSQPKILYKIKKCKSSSERKADLEERRRTAKNSVEYMKENNQTSVAGETNENSDILETKNSTTDCKYKISHLPVKINSSKIFVRHQSKSSKIRVQPNMYIQVDKKYFSKPNVIMATVYNRRLNNPSPEFMEAYSYNNSFYHINAMKDLESFNTFKYPKVCYNAENDTYLLHNELVAEGLIPSDSKIAVKTWNSTEKTDKISETIKSVVPDKLITSISGNTLRAKIVQKEKPSLQTTTEAVAKQCSVKSANLEKLNEVVRENKQKLVKIDTPLSKKKEQKIRNKIRSTRIPKTLGEIYGVGKIPFLVEVSKPGQAKHKQYLVVIQLPGNNKNQESSENNTNSPLPLTFNTDFNSDYLQEETLLSPHGRLSNCFKADTIPEQTLTNKKHAPKVGSMIGLVKVKNKILPLLEINEKRFEPLFPTKLSHLIQPSINKKENDTEWAQKTYSQYVLNEQKGASNSADDQLKVGKSLSSPENSNSRFKDKKYQLQRIMNSTEYILNQHKPKASMLGNHVRQYSTLSRRNQITKTLNYKVFPQAHDNNRRNFHLQQTCNLSCCLACPYCGQYPCACSCCQCSPCGWYPRFSCRPQCCPKFKLDYCCPRGRWDCSIPIPPCRKIDAPYPSYGESMPMWCKEPTECFDYDQHILQPKNQVSPKIHLMEESIPKVTVVDPALDRKCCRDKWCEPCPPYIDQRICFDCPYKVPVDYCCPRGRPHCYCWPERPCSRKPPPYRCFSDEDLEFPEVEVTEHDLARRFASDLYRRMGKKCKLPFMPVGTVECDLRSGEPKPVCKYDPKECCSTTCLPPGTYPAPCTMVRIPPCEIPGCDTCINCCMPLEGIKKTRCSKRCCPQDCCGYCPKEVPECPKVYED